MFRLLKYATANKVFDCPSLVFNAANAGGGGDSSKQALGIGMNYWANPGGIGKLIFATSTPDDWVREQTVVHPADTFIFGDTASNALVNATAANADSWFQSDLSGAGACLLRVGGPALPFMDAVAIPRHNKRINLGFVDGHVEVMKNSQLGYGLNGSPAAANPLARWSIYH